MLNIYNNKSNSRKANQDKENNIFKTFLGTLKRKMNQHGNQEF